mgnify:CR=1 FL=1
MPLNLPDRLPAIELLKKEKHLCHRQFASLFAGHPSVAHCHIEPHAVENYDRDRPRPAVVQHALQVEVSFMKVKGHTSKNTPVET